MTVSQTGIDLIKRFEGLRLKAYKDAVGVWTIGYGNTYYHDGKKIKEGDVINSEYAKLLLEEIAFKFSLKVDDLVLSALNQNQFDALVSFTYNLGTGNFRKSTLLKMVNNLPCDLNIMLEFRKWNKAGGKVLKGLSLRRQAESDLYFKIAK